MGAWETNGYNMSVNPYWENEDKSGGGGSDIPTPTSENIGELITYNGRSLEWADPDNVVRQVPFSESAGDVGKVLTKIGNQAGQYAWVLAQALYTAFNAGASGLESTNVEDAIKEVAGMVGGDYTERINYTADSFMLGGVQNFNVWDSENHKLTISEAFVEISIGTKRTLQDESVDIDLPKYAWKVEIPLETLKRVYEFLENPHEDVPQFHFPTGPLYLDGFEYVDDQSQTQTFSGYIVWDIYMTVSDFGDIDISADAQKIAYNQTYGVYSDIPGVWNMTDKICKMVVKTK